MSNLTIKIEITFMKIIFVYLETDFKIMKFVFKCVLKSRIRRKLL